MRSIQHLVLNKSWLGKIREKLPSHISCHLMLSHAVSCRLMPSQHLPSTGFSYMHDRQAIRLQHSCKM